MRRLPLLAVLGSALAVALFGGGASPEGPAVALAADGQDAIVVHEAPAELVLHQAGLVRVKAAAPAAPGDVVYLYTAGAYNTGYVRVAGSRLGKDLTATVRMPGRDYLGTFTYWANLPATAAHQEVSTPQFPVTIVSPPAQRSPSCGGAAPRKANGRAWVCTYDDEFNGPELDRTYWVPQRTETSGFVTGTQLTYACAQDDPETIAVEDGNLELSLVDRGEARDCGQGYRSQYAYGQVTQFQTYAQTYGKYEVRAKIPDLRVPGSQQSFWLWPVKDTYGPWPTSGEIDFAEMYSVAPGIDRPYLHYLQGEHPEGSSTNLVTKDCPLNPGEFNTYGLEWAPGRITILLNGKVCMIDDYAAATAAQGSPAPFDHPFFLSLNQAMGTTFNEYDAAKIPDRLTTQVDYVRVWR